MARAEAPPEVVELWRLLSHARSCDGFKLNPLGKMVPCHTCNTIDRRLDDGAGYFADDPIRRLRALDQALEATLAQALRVAAALEGASLPSSTRAASHQVAAWIARTRTILTLPITEIPGAEADDLPQYPGDGPRIPTPPPRKAPRRTVATVTLRLVRPVPRNKHAASVETLEERKPLHDAGDGIP